MVVVVVVVVSIIIIIIIIVVVIVIIIIIIVINVVFVDLLDLSCHRHLFVLQVFMGNTDSNTEVRHIIQPTTAMYFMVKPISWHGAVAMRLGLLGCQGKDSHSNINILLIIVIVKVMVAMVMVVMAVNFVVKPHQLARRCRHETGSPRLPG